MATLAEVGEDAILERIRSRIDRHAAAAESAVGPGDDGAVWEVSGKVDLVVSQDALVEGKDWKPGWLTPRELGRRALLIAISDLAAMGADPRYCLATVCAPQQTQAADLYALTDGLAAAGADLRCPLIGGDLSDIDGPLVIDVHVAGTAAPGEAMRRDRGRPGELLIVTGKVGAAAAGLESLRNPKADTRWRNAWKRPVPRLAEAAALRAFGIACAGDISDGLIVDAGRTARASGCGVELWLDRIPVDHRLKQSFPRKWRQFALAGGEDFELLASVAAGDLVALMSEWDNELAPLTVVGRLVKGEGLRLFNSEEGTEMQLPALTSRHYS